MDSWLLGAAYLLLLCAGGAAVALLPVVVVMLLDARRDLRAVDFRARLQTFAKHGRSAPNGFCSPCESCDALRLELRDVRVLEYAVDEGLRAAAAERAQP